jgi:hypothetical protein
MSELTRVYENDASVNTKSLKVGKNLLFLKMGLVVILLALVMTLSITSNYIFFKELLTSSSIILLIVVIKFFEIKRA